MKFYTWKDIERYLLIYQREWKKVFNAIDVYPDEVNIYIAEDCSEQQAMQKLLELFPKNVDKGNNTIKLDGEKRRLRITFQKDEEVWEKPVMPLFERVIYSHSAYPVEALTELECPVIAFHSYKGGVGRTLSLLAFAKAWTNVQNDAGNRLLIIDSDLEAPGLSWLQGSVDGDNFSYLDLLTLAQDSPDINSVVDIAVEKMGKSVITVETEQRKIEHIFLPTFRYDEQLFDIYASPNSVIKSKNREYILAEIIAKIAVRLGVSAVLVDLRAGISEYSAPLLFDPRVKKFFVTSTSMQSVIGTKKLLKYIVKGLEITEEANLPTILLSMVPSSLNESEKNDIISDIIGCFKTEEQNEQLLDNIVVELPFASELVHLTSLQQIFSCLNGREMYKTIEKIVQQYLDISEDTKSEYSEEQRKIVLKKIHNFASKQITAEANGAVQLLLTEPIRNLCLKYNENIPTVVVRGAKGSGKTFLYRQLLENRDWFSFYNSISGKNKERDGYFIPVFAPKNIGELNELLKHCIESFNEEISFAQASNAVYISNSQNLEVQSERDTNWCLFWEQLLVSSISEKYHTFDEISAMLQRENKRIVFLMDGLEEILRNVSSDTIQQKAVRVLCQDIVNILAAKYDNLGIIIFLRSDMAQNAITVNYEQFKQSYSYAELKWTSEEALKLAVWLVGQAVDDFYVATSPVESASKDVIDKHLEKLWGLKLGKNNSNEAYSSRWILAALSDFNGQLQARDIIRFLKYAAQPSEKKAPYLDRILMPTEIRSAVSICSREKIDEIKMEYESLEPIFNKLENLPTGEKILPLNLGADALTPMEEKLMMQEGYLTRDGEKLYLPEIVRHALGFRYEKGARPKVLSLLLKH